jgi:penicillin-binding protein 1A
MLKVFAALLGFLVFVALAGAGGVYYVFLQYGRDLPDYRQLAKYEPAVMTRVHAGDGRLLAEYAVEKRIFVPIEAMPKRVINAFLSAEDKSFYSHVGIDPLGVVRAMLINVRNLGSNRRLVGASTITQQVAKNFLLTNEVSWRRKIKEAILALRIEQAFPKDRILELYMNEIFLGFRAYGVAAASLNYFNKSLGELTIAEAAFLAALPKAPNNYNPIRHPNAARTRRDWVISRMVEDGYLNAQEAESATVEPLLLRNRAETEYVYADHFAEEVRRQLEERYGENALYKGGLSVRTTLDPRLQKIADEELRKGLLAYDRRHGWRGPMANVGSGLDWRNKLADLEPPEPLGEWVMAAVLKTDKDGADIGFVDDSRGRIPWSQLRWARKWLKGQKRGRSVRSPAEVLSVGDVVAAQSIAGQPIPTRIKKKKGEKVELYGEGTFALRQFPAIDGALVALDPHTGRVLAMSGGYSFARSKFNRVTQALRQPGSAFKPFVYLAALSSGYSPSTMILDAPFVIDQGPGLPKWRPANYTKKFYGPSTMRLGIEKSRNLMTVRLAQTIGMEKVAEFAERFHIVDELPQTLSMALGAGETTLLRLTTGYAMLVNGGKRITPTLIDRIQDRVGKTVFKHDRRGCVDCRVDVWTGQPVPFFPDDRGQVADPSSAYQVVSMLQGVVQRGTGIRIRAIGKPLGGKTGTTNASRDAWFIGFSPDLAVGVFTGFDTPSTLGPRETGSSVAVPIFRDFMKRALDGKPAIPFRIPRGIRMVRVNAGTGQLARAGDRKVILEAFKPGTEPTGRSAVLEGYSSTVQAAPSSGTGGLY